MQIQEILYRCNPWWENRYNLSNLIPRPELLGLMDKHFSSSNIVFVTGLRRIGKTSLFKLFIQHLIEKRGVDPCHIFYVSLDDYLLSKKTILEIIEEFRKIQKISFKEKIFLFLDEVAYKKDFELQLKNLYDLHNAKIYACSSSASILKSKKAYLTGRNVILEVLPLDFKEYLSFKDIYISEADQHLIDVYFEEYLSTGGIPEYVLHKDTDYLKELVDDIIKDIVVSFGIRSPDVLKEYFLLLMERAGKQVSLNKIANILGISPDTARRYLEMFASTYLIYNIKRYGKTNERLLSPKKIYASDLGIRNIFTGFRDKGSLFENYVFLKIKKYNPYYVYTDGTEIDFFIKDKEILMEVKYGSEMSGKQLDIFKKIKAKKKVFIKDIKDLDTFLQEIQDNY